MNATTRCGLAARASITASSADKDCLRYTAMRLPCPAGQRTSAPDIEAHARSPIARRGARSRRSRARETSRGNPRRSRTAARALASGATPKRASAPFTVASARASDCASFVGTRRARRSGTRAAESGAAESRSRWRSETRRSPMTRAARSAVGAKSVTTRSGFQRSKSANHPARSAGEMLGTVIAAAERGCRRSSRGSAGRRLRSRTPAPGRCRGRRVVGKVREAVQLAEHECDVMAARAQRVRERSCTPSRAPARRPSPTRMRCAPWLAVRHFGDALGRPRGGACAKSCVAMAFAQRDPPPRAIAVSASSEPKTMRGNPARGSSGFETSAAPGLLDALGDEELLELQRQERHRNARGHARAPRTPAPAWLTHSDAPASRGPGSPPRARRASMPSRASRSRARASSPGAATITSASSDASAASTASKRALRGLRYAKTRGPVRASRRTSSAADATSRWRAEVLDAVARPEGIDLGEGAEQVGLRH